MVNLAEFRLTEILTALIERADDDGMRLPYILCAISPNGSLTIGRFNAPGVDPDMLAEHYESEGFRLPMTITLIDQENRAIRGEITAGSTYTKYSRRGQGDGTGTERL
jgi:hypothetical protein